MGESTAKGTRGLLSAALSAEPPVQEFSPSDPEYYLEDDEGANAVFVDAARVLVWLGSGALRQVVLCVTRAPSDRLITLQLVLGELKRHGRVPQDVGGLRGALTMLRQVYRKEGLMSLLRAAYVDAMFLLPVSIANALAQFTAEVLLSRVFPKVLLRGSTLESSHTQVMLHSLMQFACDVVVIILRSPVYEMRDSIVVNYRADIVAPVRDVGAMENPAEFACASSTLSPMSAQQDDEAYLFCSAREFFSTAINRHGLWAFYRGLPFELAKAASYRANELALRMAMPYMLYLPRLGIAPCALLWLLAVTQPFDVMKRRALLTASFGMAYPGPVAFVRRIVSLEGASALWSGMKFRLCVSIAKTCFSLAAEQL